MPGFEWREQTKKSRVRGETYLESVWKPISWIQATKLVSSVKDTDCPVRILSSRVAHITRKGPWSLPAPRASTQSLRLLLLIGFLFVSSSLSGSSKLRIWCLRDSPYIKIYIPMRSIIHGLYLIYSRPDSNPNLVDTRWFTAKRLYEILNLRQLPP